MVRNYGDKESSLTVLEFIWKSTGINNLVSKGMLSIETLKLECELEFCHHGQYYLVLLFSFGQTSNISD